MAAVLSCGEQAVLSHSSAAALWNISAEQEPGTTEVSVPVEVARKRPGIVVHRRAALLAEDVTHRDRVPVTTPLRTIVDLAACLKRERLERAVNEADKRDLIDVRALPGAVGSRPQAPGIAVLRELLDRHTFTLTDSELEQRFLPLVRGAGLPMPQTGPTVNGFKVDFYWPELGLVVETDGLRYHRTPAQQSADRRRDQAHAANGLATLRFTYAQVRFEPDDVVTTLSAVAERLRAGK